LGPISIQPVEFVKFAIVIYFSALLSKRQKVIKSFSEGFLPFLFWIILICILIALQPNFSNMFLVFLVAMTMLFVGNANLLYILGTALAGFVAAGVYAVSAPYRLNRIMAYFGGGSVSPTTTKYQLQQALIALGNGGIIGLGPGQSKQSYLFLPESFGDFIFSTIGEEYGFMGLLLIFVAFGVIFFRGMQIAKKAPDQFGYFLSIGIVITLAIYLFTNAAVNTGLLPTTGVPFPFLSYGGTAVIIYSAVIGILLNISVQANIYPIKTENKIRINSETDIGEAVEN
jgi:cell division protein FtsW